MPMQTASANITFDFLYRSLASLPPDFGKMNQVGVCFVQADSIEKPNLFREQPDRSPNQHQE
jgi:hypothetical protein